MATSASISIVVVAIVLPILAIIAVGLRISARRFKSQELEKDDYLIVAALVRKGCSRYEYLLIILRLWLFAVAQLTLLVRGMHNIGLRTRRLTKHDFRWHCWGIRTPYCGPQDGYYYHIFQGSYPDAYVHGTINVWFRLYLHCSLPICCL